MPMALGDASPWLRYANQGATRRLPISPQLQAAMSFLPELGVTMEVFSGGQHGRGSGKPRVGSTRHDHGHAADVFFYKDGRRLNWSNPNDRPLFQEIVRRGREAGLTGFGAGDGYMQPGSMHIGYGAPGVWGAGGSSRNAPEWLKSAYNSAGSPAPERGLGLAALVNRSPSPEQRPYNPGEAAQQVAAAPQAPGTPAPPLGPGVNVADRPVAQPQEMPQSILASLSGGDPAQGGGNPLLQMMMASAQQSQPEPMQLQPMQMNPQAAPPSLSDFLQQFMQSRLG
jgi:hypothetical protein